MINIMQEHGYGSAASYKLEVPDYARHDSGFASESGSAMGQVLIYESAQNPVQNSDALTADPASASNAAGNYGAMIFGVGGNDGALIIHIIMKYAIPKLIGAHHLQPTISSASAGSTFCT